MHNVSTSEVILSKESPSVYKHYAGKTVQWISPDNEEQFKINQAQYSLKLSRNGYSDPDTVEYHFNSHGFRSDEFSEKTGALFLGCSFTMGMGVQYNRIWPKLVANDLGVECYNLGTGGASMDTAFRYIESYIESLDICAVFLLEPAENRIELLQEGHEVQLGPWITESSDYHAYYSLWFGNEENFRLNTLKNRMAIGAICNEHRVPLVRATTFENPKLDFGRDLLHRGPKSHRAFANIMLDKLRYV